MCFTANMLTAFLLNDGKEILTELSALLYFKIFLFPKITITFSLVFLSTYLELIPSKINTNCFLLICFLLKFLMRSIYFSGLAKIFLLPYFLMSQ